MSISNKTMFLNLVTPLLMKKQFFLEEKYSLSEIFSIRCSEKFLSNTNGFLKEGTFLMANHTITMGFHAENPERRRRRLRKDFGIRDSPPDHNHHQLPHALLDFSNIWDP